MTAINPPSFFQRASSQSRLSSYQSQKVCDDADGHNKNNANVKLDPRNHKKARSKFSSLVMTRTPTLNGQQWNNWQEPHILSSAIAVTSSIHLSFFPLSSSHPPSWMGSQGTINSDTRLQTTRYYLDASVNNPDDSNRDDYIVKSEGSSTVLSGPPGPFPSTHGQRTR